MADSDSAASHDVPQGTYELKIGESFRHTLPEFHTLRFDFKPNSSNDTDSYIAFSGSTDVQVAVTNEGAENMTTYKGSKKPVKGDKECLIVYDPQTGELRLEKLASNISVKKTRGDNEYEGALREEIQRLRSQRITSKPEPPREEPKPQRKASSIEDHMSSSGGSSDSSSSDESGSDSDSDSDAEPRTKPRSPPGSPPADRNRKESNKSEDSLSGDELDIQAALEQQLNNGHSKASAMPDDSMPDFGSSSLNANGPGSAGSSSTQQQQNLLQDDLQLSESSSDDDD
ncbi:testosterone regulated apoptosis inducer and tumor suppressor [Aphelenchoides avenae]|nr:testosterone regulated apoptosis inducer and tumor suppressor [Aphelenchus avenae]